MKILFICTGNICRSPTAHGVLRHRLKEQGITHITVDSAGTHAYHLGEAPDPRSIEMALKHGVDISDLRARKVLPADFSDYDLILALDNTHMRELKRYQTGKAHVALFLEYADIANARDVPDPYYGSEKDFRHVLDLINRGVDGLLLKLNTRIAS